jgi:hypothetical protein
MLADALDEKRVARKVAAPVLNYTEPQLSRVLTSERQCDADRLLRLPFEVFIALWLRVLEAKAADEAEAVLNDKLRLRMARADLATDHERQRA